MKSRYVVFPANGDGHFMIKTSKLILSTAITATLSLSFNIYAADVPAGVQLAADQSISFGNGAEPASLDPHKSETNESFRIERDMFEGLVVQDDSGAVIPGQAESWTIAPDYKTYTFKIRDNAKWSNGDPVTAQDFVNSWRRLVDPKTASPYAWYVEMTMIGNAKDIITGKKDPSELSVKALDNKTLEVKLEKSLPYLLNMLTLTTMSPVPTKTIEKYGQAWTQPEHIVTNGAYKLKEWIVNERLTMERSHTYWNDAKTVINKVDVLPISGNAELGRYKAGDIQITKTLPIEHYQDMMKNRPDEVIRTPSLGIYYYVFNTTVKPFDDVRVREALSYATDRDVIANKVLGQGQTAAYTFTPPTVSGFDAPTMDYQKLSQKERDAKARELLKDAGYGPNNPLKVELLYNTNDGNKRQAIVMAQMWKKIGVETTLKNQEWKTLLDTKRQGDFQIMRYTWLADYNEASTFLDVLTTGHGSNDSRYSNPEYDHLVNDAKLAPTPEKRNAMYEEAEKILARDMPIIPAFHLANVRLMDTSVGGYPMHNPQNTVYSRNLYRIKK